MSTTEAPTLPRATKPAPEPAADAEESIYIEDTAPAPIDWTTPSPAAETVIREATQPTHNSRKTGGVPVGPALVAAGNGTLMAVTTAYQIAGWAGLAGTGAVAAGGAVAAVARRRATVRRLSAARAASGARSTWAGSRPAAGQRATGMPGNSSRPSTFRSPAASQLGGRPSGARGGHTNPGTPGQRRLGSALPGSPTRAFKPGMSGQPGSKPGHARATPDQRGRSGRLARIADRLLGGDGRRSRKSAARGDTATKPSRSKTLTRRALGLTRRGVAAAWTKSRPHRSRVWAAARRGLSKTRKAAWDGLLAAFAGALSALWHWNRSKGGERMRQLWRKRRDRRAEQAVAEAATQEQATGPTDITDTVNRPTTPTPTSSQGDRMSGHHFTAAAMEMARAASAYEPQGMLQVGRDFAGLQEALQLVAESMRITTDNADAKQPLDPQIVELMCGIHQLQLKAAEMAGELVPAFRNLHHVDLERLENPRKGVAGEAMWDVRANY